MPAYVCPNTWNYNYTYPSPFCPSKSVGAEHIVLVVLVALRQGEKHLSEHSPPHPSPVFTGDYISDWIGRLSCVEQFVNLSSTIITALINNSTDIPWWFTYTTTFKLLQNVSTLPPPSPLPTHPQRCFPAIENCARKSLGFRSRIRLGWSHECNRCHFYR